MKLLSADDMKFINKENQQLRKISESINKIRFRSGFSREAETIRITCLFKKSRQFRCDKKIMANEEEGGKNWLRASIRNP